MTNIRRYYDNNDLVFTTHVTYERNPILIESIDLLTNAMNDKLGDLVIAWVILPDHIHLLTETKNSDLSILVKKMKLSYSANYRKLHGMKSGQVWQNRFYDHIILNQKDLNRHIDYIHFNPVKHSMVKDPFDWKYSLIAKYKECYDKGWGVIDKINFDGDFGE